MFQFLQPIALITAAGIVIPVIIHLWNVKQGKIIKVGSIALLQQSDRQQARSFKLKDLLLLLLRCLLILLLAMLLAGPQFVKQLNTSEEKGWILVPRAQLNEAYITHKLLIDSLTNAGFKFHYFENGFNETPLSKALEEKDGKRDQHISYWPLIEELNTLVPAALPVYIFTDNLLSRFSGNRPNVQLNMVWKTFRPGDTLAVYYKDGYLVNNNEARVAMATSKPGGTVIDIKKVTLNNAENNVQLINKNGHSLLIKTNERDTLIPLDTATKNLVIFADKEAGDARYLKASLEAIQAYLNVKLNIVVTSKMGSLPETADWLFWLSAQPIPVNKEYKKTFYYKYGEEQNLQSFINLNKQLDHADREIALTRRVQLLADSGNVGKAIWKDGFGSPLLLLENSILPRYRFYSRFKPSWNDLVWSADFPFIMYNLLFEKDDALVHSFDKRLIDENQVVPGTNNNAGANKSAFVKIIDLSNVFWLMAFVTLFIERLVSYKTKKEATHG